MKRLVLYSAIITILLLTLALFVKATAIEAAPEPPYQLENIRTFTPAPDPTGAAYVIDAGQLYALENGSVAAIALPANVIAGAVATGPVDSSTVYVGAANSLDVYVSHNGGRHWTQIPLDTDAIGGVTALAVDNANRIVYVGTDNDGVHRLRDVGSSLIASAHLLLDEPVQEIVADSTGTGMAFVRTEWNVYRAEELGLSWVTVGDLPSPATAIAIAETSPPTVYVGTASSGVRVSTDGVNWQAANQGLGYTPGTQLYVSDLVVDPAQPQVVYAGTSLIFGSGNARISPIGVAMSTDGGSQWSTLHEIRDAQVADILPVTGKAGSVYALTSASRAPLPIGEALALAPAAQPVQAASGLTATEILAWALAGIALAAFLALVVVDLSRPASRRELVPALRSITRR